MLPISNPPQTARPPGSRTRPAAATGAAPVAPPGGDSQQALGPIGSERLRALREAIENGSYPTAADVLGGLDRLLEAPDAED